MENEIMIPDEFIQAIAEMNKTEFMALAGMLYDEVRENTEEYEDPTEDCDECECCSDGFDPMPLRILKSGDRTIVFWEDGDKTIVKRAEDEEDNEYIAFTAALGIKAFGSNSALKKAIAEKTEYQKEKKK